LKTSEREYMKSHYKKGSGFQVMITNLNDQEIILSFEKDRVQLDFKIC